MKYEFHSNLIFDIGMHDGKDAAYYLHRGFNVVAVEANPVLCREAAAKFADTLKSGRLHIENVAVGKERGRLPFYVSSNSLLSSFDSTLAAREQTSVQTIEIDFVRAADLFAKYGVPYYLKIDIEGADTYCLEDLDKETRPKYISFENGPRIEEDIRRLTDLGYRRFKLISSQHLLRFAPPNQPESLMRRLRRRVRRKCLNLKNGRWRDDWSFEAGSTGPFGEETDGKWVDGAKVVQLFHEWRKLDPESWYDVHAAL